MKWRLGFWLISAFAPSAGLAQLPLAQLDAVSPAGGAPGESVSIQLQGGDLDEVDRLYTSHPGITGEVPEPGNYRLHIAQDVPAGIYDLWASGRFGITNPRAFLVQPGPHLIEQQANQNREQAMPIELDQTVHGKANSQAYDWFRFAAPGAEPLRIEILAQRLDSRMDASFAIIDEKGKQVTRVQDTFGRDPMAIITPEPGKTYWVRVSDFLYRGGDPYLYALKVTKESEAPPPLRPITRPADVAAFSLSPSPLAASGHETVTDFPSEYFGTSGSEPHTFDVALTKDRRVVVEVFSDRLGEISDFRLTAFRIQDPQSEPERIGESDDISGQPRTPHVDLNTRDPLYEFAADRDATYRIELLNQFSDSAAFQVVFREPAPDFHVVALPQSPVDKDRRASRWSSFLRRGGTVDWHVFLLRRDGFNAPVSIAVESLPEGVTAHPLVLAEGEREGQLILSASSEAPPWSGLLTVAGKASLDGTEMRRPVYGATVLWSVGDANNEPLESRLTRHLALRVAGNEREPVMIAPTEGDHFEISIAGRLEIPLAVTRHGEQVGNFTVFPEGIPGMRNRPSAQFDPNAETLMLTLDLANKDNNAFKPGDYTFCLKGEGGKIKYRANPEALERAEAELAAAEASVAKQTEIVNANPEDAEAKQALEAANQAKEAAAKKVEAAKNRANPQDLDHAFYSRPLTLTITEAPIALSSEERTVNGVPGASLALPLQIERLYGFQDPVEIELTPPKDVAGLSVAKATIPGDAVEIQVPIGVAAEAPPGNHRFTLTAKLSYNGQALAIERAVVLQLTNPPASS